MVAGVGQFRSRCCLRRTLSLLFLLFQLGDDFRDAVVALIFWKVANLEQAVLLGDGVQVGDEFREVVRHSIDLIKPLVLVLHESARAVVVCLGVGVVQVLHVEVAEHEVALHALARVFIIHQQRLLQQPHRIFASSLLQRQGGEGIKNLVLIDVVLVIFQHLLQQLDDGFAIGFAPVKRHRLLDFGVKLQLVRRS